MIQLMKSDIKNERFIIVAENLTYRDVLFKIADSMNKPRPRIRINKWMKEFIWRFEFLRSKITLSPPLLTKHTARSSISNRPYSSQKVLDTLDFNFTPVADCIERVVKNYLKDSQE